VSATAAPISTRRSDADHCFSSNRSAMTTAITMTTPSAPYGLPAVIAMNPKNTGTTGLSRPRAHLRADHHRCGMKEKEIMLIAQAAASKYSVKPANGSSTATAADAPGRAPYSRHSR
jgi:hypothetical protein